jgi:RNA polymerase sigma-70 factor (ECF subfamily)
LRAAASLSRSDREMLSPAAWEGLPHREIAEILGCSIAAVDQRLHRAKQRLTKQYRAMNRDASLRRVTEGEGS